ncbi:MAG TPA: hypothetical protein VJM57_07385, partial [Thermodesulfobacteriota bacterium]|nr:hypothetical protein [Thermodesulfobacteriota bacterium]
PEPVRKDGKGGLTGTYTRTHLRLKGRIILWDFCLKIAGLGAEYRKKNTNKIYGCVNFWYNLK